MLVTGRVAELLLQTKAKASTGAKDTTKDLTKATKETTTKEDTTKAKAKATQGPKPMDQAKATKAKETTANQKEKEATTWPLGYVTHKRRRRTTSARRRTSRSGQGQQ